MAEQESYQIACIKEDLGGVTKSNRELNKDEDNLHSLMCCSFRRQTTNKPRDPTRRILTFTGMVCLVCTFVVIGIVIIAVLLSKLTKADKPFTKPLDIVSIVPKPQNFVDRKRTILVHRQNIILWKRQVTQLDNLLKKYEEQYYKPPSCQIREENNCSSLTELIGLNCSIENNFGYDKGYPCVALIFTKVPEWVPKPFVNISRSKIPQKFAKKYDPKLLYLTCEREHVEDNLQIIFSPLQGFRRSEFSAKSESLPLVMLQFFNLPIATDIHIICRLWAENLKTDNQGVVPSKIQFSLLII
ncbi:sodium/potassium-transporting ATPase subunit beta-like [Limulus polyphemus]|uniref:Sodium/potassium-transporting ATPase subunit beta-like n=1 Tax=Limulus polyphemus TaxID=6850 RepID=A0ABM1T8H0_LIMPO|nr:sodium/potassium-transporting ATPase subunit beta-like [Limulus polyphemus]